MSKHKHTPAEIDTAVADGDCPLCLKERIAELEAERLKISDSISSKTESGEVPDNLAECVEYLMLQEYYPAMKRIDYLTAELAKREMPNNA